MKDAAEICERINQVTSWDLSAVRFAEAHFQCTQPEAQSILNGSDIKRCLFDQPTISKNVGLDLIVTPLDFKLTASTIVNTFHSVRSSEEQREIVQSATQIPIGDGYGIKFDVVSQVSGLETSRIWREIEVWAYLGEDSENKFLMKAHREYSVSKNKEEAERIVFDALNAVLRRSEY